LLNIKRIIHILTGRRFRFNQNVLAELLEILEVRIPDAVSAMDEENQEMSRPFLNKLVQCAFYVQSVLFEANGIHPEYLRYIDRDKSRKLFGIYFSAFYGECLESGLVPSKDLKNKIDQVVPLLFRQTYSELSSKINEIKNLPGFTVGLFNESFKILLGPLYERKAPAPLLNALTFADAMRNIRQIYLNGFSGSA
jgi:hypothetical protein